MGRRKKQAQVKKMGRPSKKPDIVTLKFLYEQYKSEEIAKMYGVPPSTVRSWVCLARKSGDYV